MGERAAVRNTGANAVAAQLPRSAVQDAATFWRADSLNSLSTAPERDDDSARATCDWIQRERSSFFRAASGVANQLRVTTDLLKVPCGIKGWVPSHLKVVVCTLGWPCSQYPAALRDRRSMMQERDRSSFVRVGVGQPSGQPVARTPTETIDLGGIRAPRKWPIYALLDTGGRISVELRI
jgi:hypothetical protein